MDINTTPQPTVYVAIGADFIHAGHVNILNVARSLGTVTVGLLTDAAIAGYKRLPLVAYEQRKQVVENIKGVDRVIPQNTADYTQNLLALRPRYVVHGTDWRTGVFGQRLRETVLQLLAQWGGELIEPEYTRGLSSSYIADGVRRQGITPTLRLNSLRRLLALKPLVRVLEAHNGLSGLIVEETWVETEAGIQEFDAIWESSLTDATSKGKPDNASVDLSSRIQTIEQILEVTTKPMIVDADNGGYVEHFQFTVKTLERLGVSAVMIEDKVGRKRNSLFGDTAGQIQDTIAEFCDKIKTGKTAQVTQDFMIIARIESLILGRGLTDALERAKAYVEAGADAIMIHSSQSTPDEILAFCAAFRGDTQTVPLVVVPSTYSQVTEADLQAAGVSMVIYANHLIRSAYPAMQQTAQSILKYQRAWEASQDLCLPIQDVIRLISVP